MSALADLNKFEAEMRGEFGIGSAAQFGSADLRLVSFILFYLLSAYVLLWEIAIIIELGSLIVVQESSASADMRESDFSGSTFNGAYLEKAVAYKANFSGADLSDTLTDRMVPKSNQD
ncbi:hypothetical protein JHK87_002449 [Glycine soja]|nr:hypothetical protein JHK87_002449 [Glycine soja]